MESELGDKDYVSGNLFKLTVEAVKPGMFVAELDRPWLGTPFLIQGFEIRDGSDIELLKKFCRHVYVLKDVESRRVPRTPAVDGKAVPRENARPPRAASANAQAANSPVKRLPAGLEAIDRAQRLLRLEHQAARKVLDKGRDSIEKLLHSARLGQMLDADLAEGTVETCVKSVMRDPEAMLWMTKIKNQNRYTAEHCLNVCILAIAFGRHLGKTETELQLIGLCGLLHDVGKMHIPAEILDKPGPLSEDEFAVMQQHTVIGKNLLEDQLDQSHHMAIEVAHSHHEQPDGRGYPRGLMQGEIAECSHIISLVDVYDAITSNRCYSRERLCSEAQQVIFANRGGQFDGELALKFIQAIGPYPPGTLVELYNGMAGVVLASRPKYRHLPTVLLLRDIDKQPIEERTLDLSRTDGGSLDKQFLIKRTLVDGAYGISLLTHQVAPEPVYLTGEAVSS